MKGNSRADKSIKNTIVALAEQGIYTVMSFVCRTVFIYSLGKTYLGFNGLFSDILSLLSLAELGVGTAILYSMYKPAAQGDHKKVAALLNLYKRVYNSIGIVITVVGLCLTPFLKYLISDVPDMREVPIIYILLVSFASAGLFVLVNPFISLWIGDSYLLEKNVVFIICLNLYMRFIRNTFLTFIDTYGLFKQVKPKCIAEAVINLTVSLLMVGPLKMGIYGVLLGTFISNITTNFWYEPYLLFKKFDVRLRQYFILFVEYFSLTIISAGVMSWICNDFISVSGWAGFIVKVIVTCLGINIFYIAVFIKTDEFKYFWGILKARIVRLKPNGEKK